MATPAPLVADKESAAFINTPRLPPGLEAAIRSHMAVVGMLYQGKGHISITLNLAPDKPASWDIDLGGHGQERR